MSRIKQKIANLLRLANDPGCRPTEEAQVRAHAQRLMDKYDLSEEDFELRTDKLDRALLDEYDNPVPWREMLLLTLCEILHGGVVSPFFTSGRWQLWVVGDDVNFDQLRDHYEQMAQSIEDLIGFKRNRSGMEFRRLPQEEIQRRMEGYAFGCMAHVGQAIMSYLRVDQMSDVDLSDLPFVITNHQLDAAQRQTKTGPVDPVERAVSSQHDSFQRQIDNANQVFQKVTSMPVTEIPDPDNPDGPMMKVIEPHWGAFEEGRTMADHYIGDDVIPGYLLEPR